MHDLPPFLFAGGRFLIAGLLLLGGALAAGERLPRRPRDYAILALVGLFLLGGGNTMVVWAEQFTPSGMASLFVVTVVLRIVLFYVLVPGGTGRLSWQVITVLALGLRRHGGAGRGGPARAPPRPICAVP